MIVAGPSSSSSESLPPACAARPVSQNSSRGTTTVRRARMIAENQRKSNVAVAAGVILQLVARLWLIPSAAQTHDSTLAALGIGVAVVGTALLIYGCCQYALAKGYSAILGLLGLFSILG